MTIRVRLVKDKTTTGTIRYAEKDAWYHDGVPGDIPALVTQYIRKAGLDEEFGKGVYPDAIIITIEAG
jgi:hypothetical protein